MKILSIKKQAELASLMEGIGKQITGWPCGIIASGDYPKGIPQGWRNAGL